MKKILLLCCLVAVFAFGCKGEEQKKTADLVYVNWAEGVAYTHLIKHILEKDLGYEVTITAADVAPAYAAVAKGNKDVYMECWPELHKDYLDKFQGKFEFMGDIYEGTICGLVVPDYVTIDNISELKANADKFDGRIVGIDAGAGMMKTTETIISEYDLGMELIASSGPAMTTALKKAITDKKWIVVTGWKPHWMFGRWNLKVLKQDGAKYWNQGVIKLVGRKGLSEEKPELAKFLNGFFMTDAQISSLMIDVNENDDINKAVEKWIGDNEEAVKKWVANVK